MMGASNFCQEPFPICNILSRTLSCQLPGKSCLISALSHCNCSLAQRKVPGLKDLLGGSALLVG